MITALFALLILQPVHAAIQCGPDGVPVGGQIGVPLNLPELLPDVVAERPAQELLRVQVAWLPEDEEQRYRFQEVVDIDWQSGAYTQVDLYDGELPGIVELGLREAELLGTTDFATGHLDLVFCMPAPFRHRGLVFAHYGAEGAIEHTYVVPFAWRSENREGPGLWFSTPVNPATAELLDSFNEVTVNEVTDDVARATGVVPQRYLAESLVQQNLKSFTDLAVRDEAPLFAGEAAQVIGNQVIVTGADASVRATHAVDEVYGAGEPILEAGHRLTGLERFIGPIAIESRGVRRPALVVDGRADFDAAVSDCSGGLSRVTASLRYPSVLDSEIALYRTDTEQWELVARHPEAIEADVPCAGRYVIESARNTVAAGRGGNSMRLRAVDTAEARVHFDEADAHVAFLVYRFRTSSPLTNDFPVSRRVEPGIVERLWNVDDIAVLEGTQAYGCSEAGDETVDSIDEIVANASARLSPEEIASIGMDDAAFTDGDGDGSVCNRGERGDGTGSYSYIYRIDLEVMPNLGAGKS
jgi:hypothetical protein